MPSILINYADGEVHNRHREAQVQSAKQYDVFDQITEYSREDIDGEFISQNETLINHPHGAGLWIWKPYIILQTIKKAREGDIVFYCDSDWCFEKNPKPFIELAEQNDIVLFHENGDMAGQWTAPNTFIAMDAYLPQYANSRMLLAGYSVWKSCKKSIDFLEKWLQLCCRPEVIMPINYNGGHCFDQSILTLLAKKEGIEAELSPKMNGTILENSLDKQEI